MPTFQFVYGGQGGSRTHSPVKERIYSPPRLSDFAAYPCNEKTPNNSGYWVIRCNSSFRSIQSYSAYLMHQGMTNRHRLSFRSSAFVTNISMFIGLKSKHNSQIPSLKIIFCKIGLVSD